jgi:HlyD family secretion protein
MGGKRPEDEGKRTVWALRGPLNDQPQAVQIKTGVSDGTSSEIVEGDLKEGDLLITEIAGGEPKPSGPGAAMRRGF